MKKTILLSHGEGGIRTHELIEQVILKYFPSKFLSDLNDAALLPVPADSMLVFTTDNHVVDPIFFPGGDIGKLAIYGTINDLAVCGATPLYLSFSLILEEGFQIAELEKILASAQKAAAQGCVEVVTGDTKVVPRGMADKIYINTSGVGFKSHQKNLHPDLIQEGDVILFSGPIGQHGAAIMAERLNLNQDQALSSDVAPLTELCQAALNIGGVRVMRDATRGGLATVLNEFARNSGMTFFIDEMALPISSAVRNLCEIIGVEPYYLANEGAAVLIVSPDSAAEIETILRENKLGKDAAIIGVVQKGDRPEVRLKTSLGTHRIITMLAGGQFPRIC
ncbi:hydrogenase expression/formation protein HypE [candidate division CSSED10-310 bacterium]|uniref:Hydrogenase expression/formation protein HypE n=1 Tax=candidate division CSSED10-310 bacterium TaxID=2855610 RepID=A0ABV6YWI7_UNCC1